jgi:TPR repeat protein
MLAIAIVAASMNTGLAFAQSVVPAVTPATSAEDAVRKGQEAFDKKDYATALEWLRNAADHGNARAQAMIAMMYEKGLGVAQDYSQAVQWYFKSANQGDASGEAGLGGLLAKTREDKYNRDAMMWLRKAADQGNADAEFSIAAMYFRGQGVQEDDAQAAIWFRKAADQGNVDAQAMLGTLYLNGLGVPQDYTQALNLFRKPADLGNVDAQFALGILYMAGWGVKADRDQAEAWFRKAAAQGNEKAKGYLVTIEQERQKTANAIPPAVQYRCVLETMPPSNDAKENGRRYDACVKANMDRLFGSRRAQ